MELKHDVSSAIALLLAVGQKARDGSDKEKCHLLVSTEIFLIEVLKRMVCLEGDRDDEHSTLLAHAGAKLLALSRSSSSASDEWMAGTAPTKQTDHGALPPEYRVSLPLPPLIGPVAFNSPLLLGSNPAIIQI